MKLYTDLAEYYYEIEKVERIFEDEVLFLDSIFKKHRVQSVVDIGCGTGEHVTALQGKGYKTIGIDSSRNMFEIAQKRYPHCTFEHCEVKNFNPKEKFDAAICLFGTFNYLLKDEDITHSLKQIKQFVKGAGIVIFDVWNAQPIKLIKKKPISYVSAVKVGGHVIRRNRGFILNEEHATKNTVEVNYIYHFDRNEIKDKHIMRVFELDEFLHKLRDFQMEVFHIFGNYKMDKYKQLGSRILIVAKNKG